MRVSADPHFQLGPWYAMFYPWAEATWVCQRADNGTWAVRQQAELTRPCGLSAGSEPVWAVRNDSARIDDYLNPFHFRFLLSDDDHVGLMGSRVSAGASYTVMMANKLPPAVA
nr:hypothetical protein Iba_chr09aCG11870 [Ipomoea batatas]